MENAEFNEWAFYPLSLMPREIENPLDVIFDFFNDDWLPGHIKRLRTWRDQVINEGYYKGLKNSPAELLYNHKLNINLIEALYLLKEQPVALNSISTISNLEHEENTWRDFPRNLEVPELQNPFLFINQFFQDYQLPQYREMLHDWLEYGLSAKAANEFIETKDLITVYENLQKLYSAAWLINQRLSDEPYLKNDQININMETLNTICQRGDTEVCLYHLSTDLTPESQGMLKKLINIVKHKVPTVQAIIFLGALLDQPDRIFLLVLTSDSEQNQASALSSTIEESCQETASVTTLVHYASPFSNGLRESNAFFNHALNCPVIYLSGDFLLPVAKPIPALASDASFNWERWRSQGREFLTGAKFYLDYNAAKPALFSLHQCAECLMIALVRGVLGYRTNNHNLTKLLHITEMFTGNLTGVFDLDVPEKKELFDLLKHAYVSVRYRDTFEPDIKLVATLYQDIKYFVSVAEQVYERYLMMNSL